MEFSFYKYTTDADIHKHVYALTSIKTGKEPYFYEHLLQTQPAYILKIEKVTIGTMLAMDTSPTIKRIMQV